MKLDISKLQPGDVVIVEMGIWIIRALIWIQAVLSGKAKFRKGGHVIVVTHRDEKGRLWGIEGRPGGIGWADLTKRDGKWGVANITQPKTDAQRLQIVETMKKLLGVKYDYGAYIVIALNTMGIKTDWTDYQGNDVPANFICSSVADYVYEDVGLDNPGSFKITRMTTPADWMQFIVDSKWYSDPVL